jgi:hypothetical protein
MLPIIWGIIYHMKERRDSDAKTVNFVKELGIINDNFKPSLIPRYTRIQICKLVARPIMDNKKS